MTVGDAAAHAGASGLVGRRDEVAALRAALHDARAARPAFIVVEGEAGIGKTRLVRHIAEQAVAGGFDVHLGRCHERLALPYLALTSLLDRLAAVAAGSPALHTLAPVIDRLLGRVTDTDLLAGRSSEEERALLFHATSQALLTLAGERPVLVALDDMHWIDPPTLDLAAHFVDALDATSLREGARVLFVATCRSNQSGDVAVALERLARTGVGRRIDVGGLGRGEVGELLRALGIGTPSRQAIDAVVRLTRGNPLAVEGVVRQVRSGELADLDRVGQISLPVELEDHAARRVADLQPATRPILTVAALLDRTTTIDELATVGGFTVEAVTTARDDGVEHGVLVGGGDGVRFAHALFSRALAQSVPTTERERLHSEIAARLSTVPDAAIVEVGHHLLAAGSAPEPDAILRICAAAGEHAWTQLAWTGASQHFAAAASAADVLDRPVVDRGELWLRAARAANRDHDMAAARTYFAVAMPLLEQAGDQAGIAVALAERALLEHQTGTLDIDIDPLADALGALEPTAGGSAARTLAQLADLLWAQGRIDESHQAAARALELGRAAGDDVAIARAHLARGMAHLVLLELEAAHAAMAEARAAAAAGDDRWWSTAVACRLALVRLLAGHVGEADRLAADAVTAARAVRQLGNEAMAAAVSTAVAAIRGDRPLAEEAAADADRAAQLAGYAWSTGISFPALTTARLLSGDLDAAERAVDLWLARTGDAKSPYRTTAALTRLVIAAHRGDRAALDELLIEHDRLVRRPWPVGMAICQWGPALVEVASVGDVELPLTHARRMLEQLTDGGVVFTDGLVLFVPRLRGVARLLDGDVDGGIELLADAAARARAMGATAEVARTNLDLANAHASAGSIDEARTAVLDAVRAFEAISAPGWAARARDLQARLGAGEPPSPYEVGAVPERKRAVILFTDIVESTSLTETLGDAEFRGRTATLERCIRGAVAHQGGYTMTGVRLGDGLLALFPLAPAAAAAAHAAHECAAEVGLRLRIGIHAGDLLITEDTAHGAAVNITARVCAEADPAETLVTDQVRTLIGDDWHFDDRGVRALKGVSDAPRLFCITPTPNS